MTDHLTDAWLAGPLTSAAYGWRLERRDGVTIGFTSHDRDVEIGGLHYHASPGMEPSAISHSLGLESSGLEISGAINHAAIREDDLSAGRWDRAALSVFLFDWTQLGAGQRHLTSGQLGEVTYSDDRFQVDVDGVASRLNGAIVPQTSPGCRAQFCDADCGLNHRRYTSEHRAANVAGDRIFLSGRTLSETDEFSYGTLRWLTGRNAGLTAPLLSNDGQSLWLANPPFFAVEPNTRVQLLQGCNKTLAVCSGRFGNAVNFRGEPYLPGNDLLTRYPGASG